MGKQTQIFVVFVAPAFAILGQIKPLSVYPASCLLHLRFRSKDTKSGHYLVVRMVIAWCQVRVVRGAGVAERFQVALVELPLREPQFGDRAMSRRRMTPLRSITRLWIHLRNLFNVSPINPVLFHNTAAIIFFFFFCSEVFEFF